MYQDDWKRFKRYLQPPYGPHGVISAQNNYTLSCIISYFKYPINMGNVRMCYKERHTLLFKCLITLLRCIRMIRTAFASIYNPHMVHTLSFLPKLTLKFNQKYQLLGTPSVREMGCCVARRGNHCCLIVS